MSFPHLSVILLLSAVFPLIAQGAKLQAEDITLFAQRDIVLEAAANQSEIHGRSQSSNASLGATLSFGGSQNGLSFQIAAAQSQGKANGTETVWDNTLVTASDTLSVKSGRDTSLRGAQLAGETVGIEVGGDLLIETLQDFSQYENEQKSSGFSISLCIPQLCGGMMVTGNLNASEQEIKHNYRSAVGQSGIFAGDGGFEIEVRGNTELIGAAITSTQTAIDEDRNRLVTASLTSSDLENIQQTQSSGSSAGIGFGSDASALTTLAHNATGNLLANLDAQAGLPEEQNQHSQTQSVISPARITITGTGDEAIDERSRETVALLTSRDPETANQSLQNSLTLQQAQVLEEKLKEARENRAAGRIVGEVLSSIVGDIAAAQIKSLNEQGKTEEAQLWADGSPMKLALHGLAGLIEAKVGDGNLVAGALGAMGQEALAPMISDYLTSQGITGSDHDELLKLGMSLAGAATGALIDGTSGAGTGATAAYLGTTNNYLTHEQKNARDKALAQCKTESECQRIREAYQELSDRQDQIAAQAIEAARNCVGMVECTYAQSQLEAIGKEIFDAKTPGGEISQEMRVRWAMSGAALQEVEARYNSAECDLSTACANARTAGTLAAGGIVTGSAYKLISLCLTQPATCNSIGINLAELATGDALPVGLGITAATTAVKTADKITEAVSSAKGGGVIEEASVAAFRAAEQVDEFSVPLKHLPDAAGRWAKFAEGTNPNVLIKEALSSSSARFLPNSVEGSYSVVTDLGRVVGTNGETSLRVIIGQDGKIWTAFPIK